jgi:type IV secretory pathway VirB2 component (pilin)
MNSKKLFFAVVLVCLVSVLFVPLLSRAAEGLVPCDGPTTCKFEQVKGMLTGILNFLVKDLAAPLAILGVTIGAILMMISAGNPNMMSLGKKTLVASIIGLALVFGTSAIINFILGALQFKGSS